MQEVWRPVAGYEDSYEVSNLGRIRRVKLMNPSKKVKGHVQVCLTDKDGNKKSLALHRLVAAAFIPNPENKPLVIHKDNDARNNQVDNLEWADEKDSRQGCGTPVLQIDRKTGQIVAEYSSQAEASAATGIVRPDITGCLTGRLKSAGGFLWRYKDTGENP